jgi:hypothetical protein
MESKIVFIDTEVFVNKGLNFNDRALDAIRVLGEIGKINLVTTTIIKKEVERKIKENLESAFRALKRFRRKDAGILKHSEIDGIKALFGNIDLQEALSEALNEYHEFIRISSTETLDLDKVAIEEVFDLYFSESPPFSIGKKNEFPDAFSLKSLLSYLNGESAYVISNDQDLVSFCVSEKNLLSLNRLEEFLDIYNLHEDKITLSLKRSIVGLMSEIHETIESKIYASEAYNDESCWQGSEVTSFKVLEIHDFEPQILSVVDYEAMVAYEVKVDLEVTVDGPDFLNGIYYKESHETVAINRCKKTTTITQIFSIEAWYRFHFDKESGNIDNLTEEDFEIEGLSNGLFVAIEESM